MRLHIMSDLHLEMHAEGGTELIRGLDPTGVDVLVLAGDITMARYYENLESVFRPLAKRYPRRDGEARRVSAGTRSRRRHRGGCDPVRNLPRSHHHLHRRAVDGPGATKCLADDRRHGTQGDQDMSDSVPIRKLPSGVPGLDE